MFLAFVTEFLTYIGKMIINHKIAVVSNMEKETKSTAHFLEKSLHVLVELHAGSRFVFMFSSIAERHIVVIV